jgi:hypothetical protein
MDLWRLFEAGEITFEKKINAHVHIPCALSVLAKKHYSSWCFQAQGGYSSFGKLVLKYNMDLQVSKPCTLSVPAFEHEI